jgi:hypothetical protein
VPVDVIFVIDESGSVGEDHVKDSIFPKHQIYKPNNNNRRARKPQELSPMSIGMPQEKMLIKTV